MQKRLVFLLLLTLLLTIAWISSAIYNTKKTSTISSDLQIAVIPINGTFDQSAVALVTSRRQVTPLYSIQGVQVASESAKITPSPELTPTIPASSSAEEEPSTETVPVPTTAAGTSP